MDGRSAGVMGRECHGMTWLSWIVDMVYDDWEFQECGTSGCQRQLGYREGDGCCIRYIRSISLIHDCIEIMDIIQWKHSRRIAMHSMISPAIECRR